MHARIDQLLSALDREPVDATVHAHIEQCASCTAQLQQLTQVTEQLRALPQLDAPKQSWQQIAAQLPSARVARPQWHSRAGVAALAASALALTIAISEWREPRVLTAVQMSLRQPIAADGSASLQQLVEQSRQLEQVLEYLPQRPTVERVGMAATVDTIEQRVQWLDWQLSTPPDVQSNEKRMNAEQTQSLWRERVTLMDSLVKLRYAESERASF